jgi:predicted lipid-binding transport protein (Tim44 family)
MSADIILYAIIALGLGFWLRNMLGETSEDDIKRPNPIDEYKKQMDAQEKEAQGNVTQFDDERGPENAHVDVTKPTLNPATLAEIDNKAVEQALFKIAMADKSFNLDDFIEKVQDAFVIIINAYSEGDRETLNEMLSQQVYEPFIEAIEDREKRGESLEMDVHAVKKAEIRKAWIDGKMAYIAIRFQALETAVLKNKDGKILSGNPEVVSEKIDVWTFGKNTRSGDPRWFLYETDMDDDVAFQDEYKASSEDTPAHLN